MQPRNHYWSLPDKLPLVLCSMNGGLIPQRLYRTPKNFPLELGLHLHAYHRLWNVEKPKALLFNGSSIWLSITNRQGFKVGHSSCRDRHLLGPRAHVLQAIPQCVEAHKNKRRTHRQRVINQTHDRKPILYRTMSEPRDCSGLDFLFCYTGMIYKGFSRTLLMLCMPFKKASLIRILKSNSNLKKKRSS